MVLQAFQTVTTGPNTNLAPTQPLLYNLQFVGPRLPTYIITDQLNRAQQVLMYRRYAVGDHDAFMSNEMRELLGVTSVAFSPFAINYQDIVIQTMVDRCILQSMEAPGNDRATQWANDVYEYTRMDALQGDLHEATIRDGDAGIMVDWDEDNQQVKYTLQEAYDGTQGMIFIYRSKSVPVMDCAIKIWQIFLDLSLNVLSRVNIYYPDHVEKYFAINQAPLKAWQGGDISVPQYDPTKQRTSALNSSRVIKRGSGQSRDYMSASAISDGYRSTVIHFEPEEPIQYYTMRDGSPMGIPVIHFRNRGRQNYGYSEIKNSIPPQNALNRLMYSMVINAEYNGFNLLVTRGFNPPQSLRPGTIIKISADTPMTKDQVADATRIEAGNMSPFIDTANWFANEIGKITRTPSPEFMAENGRVSGEALKQLEIGLIGKSNRFMVKAGNAWEDVFMMANRMQQAYGNKQPPAVDAFKANWRSPEIRDDLQTIQGAMLMRPVVGDAQTLRNVAPIYDLDEQAILAILDEKKQEDADKLTAMQQSSMPMFGGQPPMTPGDNNDGSGAGGNTQVHPQETQGDAEGVTEAGTPGEQEVTAQ